MKVLSPVSDITSSDITFTLKRAKARARGYNIGVRGLSAHTNMNM